MIKSFKLFFHYFIESIKEIKNNFKLYLIYVVALCAISIVQIALDTMFYKDDLLFRFFSKTLFSIIPLLVLSKILYVIKIRNFGLGDYGTVVWRFILYNFYYFSLLILSLSLYVLAATYAGTLVDLQMGFLLTSFLLAPFIYVVLFFSLTPYVAVFNDEDEPVFVKSRNLSSKNIFLVILNHLFSLIIPLAMSSILLINDKYLKIAVSIIFSVPEAIFAILMVLTTTKIYMYLTERD